MKKRIIAILLLVVMMFATFTTMSLAKITITDNVQPVIGYRPNLPLIKPAFPIKVKAVSASLKTLFEIGCDS